MRRHKQSCSCYYGVNDCYLDFCLSRNHRKKSLYSHLLHIRRCRIPVVVEVDWP